MYNLHKMDPYKTCIISDLLFYDELIVKINHMNYFIIGQFVRSKMAP